LVRKEFGLTYLTDWGCTFGRRQAGWTARRDLWTASAIT